MYVIMYVICIDFVMNKLMYFDMFLYNFYKGNVCFKDYIKQHVWIYMFS